MKIKVNKKFLSKKITFSEEEVKVAKAKDLQISMNGAKPHVAPVPVEHYDNFKNAPSILGDIISESMRLNLK